MSVGVCIVNRNGIALAADSAGTFGGHQMFYNSVDKLFPLSDKYGYGAIIYSNLNVHKTSLDQIMREFKHYLDEKDEFEDFYQIADEFKSFLENKNEYYKFPDEEKNYCETLIRQVIVEWKDKLQNALQVKKAKATALNNVINEIKVTYENTKRITGSSVQKYIHVHYRGSYEAILNQAIPELSSHKRQVNALWKIITEYFNSARPASSGIFFAGYGKNDAYPKYVHIHLYSVLKGEARIWEEDRSTQSTDWEIIPLAQNEVILTFCQGISGTLMDKIPGIIDQYFDNKIGSFSGSDASKKALKAAFADCPQAIRNVLNSAVRSETNKTLAFVAVLPIPEMAFFAENLVNITALKRTYVVDGNQQTVGGPTDVAVITKAEGFKWVKREAKIRG